MAAELNFCFAAARDDALDDGEMRKTKNPKQSNPAKTRVMGFVRRSDLGSAMMDRVRLAWSAIRIKASQRRRSIESDKGSSNSRLS